MYAHMARIRLVTEYRVRTKPLARRTQPRACLRVQSAVASVTERSFCDRTTKANAGRHPAPQHNPDLIRGYILALEQFASHYNKSPELMGAEEIG
jgi:hypothetical protein